MTKTSYRRQQQQRQERANRQFNEEVSSKKPILDIVTLRVMYPQHADWLDEEAKRRGENQTCNCGNCLIVALKDKFDIKYPEQGAFRIGWPAKIDAYPEGWGKLNRDSLKENGSGWEVGQYD